MVMIMDKRRRRFRITEARNKRCNILQATQIGGTEPQGDGRKPGSQIKIITIGRTYVPYSTNYIRSYLILDGTILRSADAKNPKI